MRNHAKFFSVGAVLGTALFVAGCVAVSGDDRAPEGARVLCWDRAPWTERLADLMGVEDMTVQGVDDRAGWMERWNAVPPQTRLPVPDAIFWFTTPRAVNGAVGIVFVHAGCEVYTALVSPAELAYLLGRGASYFTIVPQAPGRDI